MDAQDGIFAVATLGILATLITSVVWFVRNRRSSDDEQPRNWWDGPGDNPPQS